MCGCTPAQTRQAKKKWRGEGKAMCSRMCSPIPIFLLVLVVGLFTFMGSFYGVLINSLDMGKAHHEKVLRLSLIYLLSY